MTARRFRTCARPLLLVGLLSGSACASFGGQPTPAPWVAGSYDFRVVVHGETILGTIEVGDEGPTAVATSLGACLAPMSQVFRPWNRSRSFDCAGRRRVVVTVGTQNGVPVAGSMSSTTTVTREEVLSRTCLQWSEPEVPGGRVCMEWSERVERVTRDVTETSRIMIVSSGPPGLP